MDLVPGASRHRSADLVRRTAWLLLGAALGVAALLLGTSLWAAAAAGLPELPRALVASVVTLVCLAVVVLVGLVPGVRELEVTAARTMLGVRRDLVVPQVARPEHRARTVAWVTLHLAGGMLAAAFLLGLLPGVAVVAAAAVSGRATTLAQVRLGPPTSLAGGVLVAVACLLALGLCLLVPWLLGRAATATAPAFLGPTAGDRLQVAETRLAAEAEHTRLARELHDGIGHALTIIGLQATAARQGTGRSPDEALALVETTAREAVAELDAVLALLRDGARDDAGAPAWEPDLTALEKLVTAHRHSGLEVVARLPPASVLPDLPDLVSRTAYRIAAEGITNARRHGARGTVEVLVVQEPSRLTIEVTSPLSARRPGSRSTNRRGRGLDGVRERVLLFGGTVESGPTDDAGHWVLRTVLPTGGQRQ
jgi:signal transduction histidine kinase